MIYYSGENVEICMHFKMHTCKKGALFCILPVREYDVPLNAVRAVTHVRDTDRNLA